MIEALTRGPRRVCFRYVEYHAGVYPLGRLSANILVGARTRLATPFGRGGPVQPLSRGECWSSSRVYIGSTPTSLGTNFSTKGRRMRRWVGSWFGDVGAATMPTAHYDPLSADVRAVPRQLPTERLLVSSMPKFQRTVPDA
jgi:hypothetical protein